MPPQGRLGDRAENPADGHGRSCCLHDAIGPAVDGSPDVFVNYRKALRITDPGIHQDVRCCGPNTWNAAAGSPTVFINNRNAHRLGDETVHCGGVGRLIEGSPDVIVGDAGTAPELKFKPRKPAAAKATLPDRTPGPGTSGSP
jgi:uncharacterized Zn-binding protein involved in type VI secretion